MKSPVKAQACIHCVNIVSGLWCKEFGADTLSALMENVCKHFRFGLQKTFAQYRKFCVEPQFIFVLLTEAARLCVVAASITHVGCWRVIHMRSFLQNPKASSVFNYYKSDRKDGKEIKKGRPGQISTTDVNRDTQSLERGSKINLS